MVSRPMTARRPSTTPCTPRGCIELMERHGIDLAGRNVCVVGRGVTVGRSIGLLLGRKDVNATVDICHTGTTDLAEHVRRADVVISCTGSTGLAISLAEVADERGVSPQQVALAWELAQSEVVIPIPGAKRPRSITDSAAATEIDLTDRELERLDAS